MNWDQVDWHLIRRGFSHIIKRYDIMKLKAYDRIGMLFEKRVLQEGMERRIPE